MRIKIFMLGLLLCVAGCQSWPVYDQNPLRINVALLTSLRAGDTTNAIEHLDAMLELETLAAMRNRSSLDERDRKILDQTLERVARYRQQYPWVIDTNTNGLPPTLPSAATWVEEQKQVEAFLRDFAKQ